MARVESPTQPDKIPPLDQQPDDALRLDKIVDPQLRQTLISKKKQVDQMTLNWPITKSQLVDLFDRLYQAENKNPLYQLTLC
ncbi:hypothetical protein HYU92_05140 [Candidatus Curtissbacteria bacterium]|nr:hypothetical protein [Candidatus Curtissbacteria bacterium]